MASLVLGIAGAAALGPSGLAFSGFLGMSGAQIGYLAGSTLGSMLFQPNMPDIQGPRLGDLKVQSSTYGTMIPIFYGTARGAGQVIWASDLIEVANEEEAGGKGGPSQSVTTYTYFANCAVGICEGEITGIRKIWANGDLIYDASLGNSGPTGQSSNIRIYTGSETQVADSLLESYLGAGNVPAHRGLAYVVFENLPLEKYGNRIPNFSFEVVATGAITTPTHTKLSEQEMLHFIEHPFVDGLYLATERESGTNNVILHVIDAIAGTDREITIDDSANGSGYMTYVEFGVDLITGEALPINEIWVCTHTGGTELAVAFDVYSLTLKRRIIANTTPGINAVGKIIFDKSNKQVLALTSGSTVTAGVRYIEPFSMVWNGAAFSIPGISSNWFTISEVIGKNSFCAISYFNFAVFFSNGFVTFKDTGVTFPSLPYIAYDSLRERYACFSTNVSSQAVFRTFKDNYLFTVEDIQTTNLGMSAGSSLTYWPIADKYLYRNGDDVKILNADTFQVEQSFTKDINSGERHNNFEIPSLPEYFIGYVNLAPTSGAGLIPITDRIDANTVTLSSIVTDICDRVELAAGDIDVTQLTDEVEGYVIGQQMSARAALDGLQAAFFFDAVESN